MALFIVALVASMSMVMLARLARDTERTTLLLRQAKAYYYAQGTLLWAKDQLRRNWEEQKPNRLIDRMPSEMPKINVDGFHIESTIYDMQARFNINNLNNQGGQEQFLRLLNLLVPKLNEEVSRKLVKYISEWVSPQNQEGDAKDYYLTLSPPYRPAHRAMISISELRLVKGMSPALYATLSPYLAALPQNTAINPQTASPEILAILSPTMTLASGKALMKLRDEAAITTTAAFVALDVAKSHQIKAEMLTIPSSYFLLKTEVSIENQQTVLYTLLERQAGPDKAIIHILWQSKGVW